MNELFPNEWAFLRKHFCAKWLLDDRVSGNVELISTHTKSDGIKLFLFCDTQLRSWVCGRVVSCLFTKWVKCKRFHKEISSGSCQCYLTLILYVNTLRLTSPQGTWSLTVTEGKSFMKPDKPWGFTLSMSLYSCFPVAQSCHMLCAYL